MTGASMAGLTREAAAESDAADPLRAFRDRFVVAPDAVYLNGKAVKVYVYPYKDPSSGEIVTAESLVLAPSLQHLQAFLLESHRLESLRRYDEGCLPIHTPDVLRRIQTGDPSWEALVPPSIVEIIKRRRLFGYR